MLSETELKFMDDAHDVPLLPTAAKEIRKLRMECQTLQELKAGEGSARAAPLTPGQIAREAADELDRKIEELICEFHEETGLLVDAISLERFEGRGDQWKPVVKVEVILDR